MFDSVPFLAVCRGVILRLALLAFAGCAVAGSTIADKLDPVTGVTITYCEVPLVFYRDNSGRAAFARNYVHLGPLEVNRGGNFRYYLWLGIWSTMQDIDGEEQRTDFDSIVLFADGEAMPLQVAGWTAAAIGASESVYVRPAASTENAYYAVTVDQIRLITEAKDLRLLSSGPVRYNFELWDEQLSARESLAEFFRNAVY